MTDIERCSMCKGKGKVLRGRPGHSGPYGDTVCPICVGTGKVTNRFPICPGCKTRVCPPEDSGRTVDGVYWCGDCLINAKDAEIEKLKTNAEVLREQINWEHRARVDLEFAKQVLERDTDTEIARLKKILACIEEGGERYFTSYQDQVEHLQALAYRAHTPWKESDATQTENP